jgi:hypothetical protein
MAKTDIRMKRLWKARINLSLKGRPRLGIISTFRARKSRKVDSSTISPFSKKMVGYFLKIGHCRFLTCPSHCITHTYPTILTWRPCYPSSLVLWRILISNRILFLNRRNHSRIMISVHPVGQVQDLSSQHPVVLLPPELPNFSRVKRQPYFTLET